jgi:hypothetical protein
VNYENVAKLESKIEMVEGQVIALKALLRQLTSQHTDIAAWVKRLNADAMDHGIMLKLLKIELRTLKGEDSGGGGAAKTSMRSEPNALKFKP